MQIRIHWPCGAALSRLSLLIGVPWEDPGRLIQDENSTHSRSRNLPGLSRPSPFCFVHTLYDSTRSLYTSTPFCRLHLHTPAFVFVSRPLRPRPEHPSITSHSL